ncbi:MAG: DUF1427 family protein [Pseudomonadota bacterium]
MNIKTALGLLLGVVIGIFCSVFSIPVPAPPVFNGALLVVAMTTGYILTDKYLAKQRPQTQLEKCGGPSGNSQEKETHD